jgi:hypothetical protein
MRSRFQRHPVATRILNGVPIWSCCNGTPDLLLPNGQWSNLRNDLREIVGQKSAPPTLPPDLPSGSQPDTDPFEDLDFTDPDRDESV